MRFSRDRRGQSVVVGTVILFGFLIVAMAVYQAQVVPTENANVEFEHSQQVEGDFVDLRNSITSAGAAGDGRSTSVQLGTRYPQRTFFVNPPPVTGEIRTTDSNEARISNVSVDADGNAAVYWDDRTDGDDAIAFETRSIRYSPGYNELRDGPDLVYEHSLVVGEFDRTVLGRSGQTAVSGERNRLRLTALDGDLSRSAVDRRSVDPQSISQSRRSVALNATGEDPIVVELPTDVSMDRSEDLETEWERRIGPDVGTVTVDGGVVRIELDNENYRLDLSKVGVGTGATVPNESDGYIVDVPATGGAAAVEVRDRFNNPVEDAEVSVFVGDEFETTLRTDDDGRAEFTPEGSPKVELTINDNAEEWESVIYRAGTVGAGANEDNINPSGETDVVLNDIGLDGNDVVEMQFRNQADEDREFRSVEFTVYYRPQGNTRETLTITAPGNRNQQLELRGGFEELEEPFVIPAGGTSTMRFEFDQNVDGDLLGVSFEDDLNQRSLYLAGIEGAIDVGDPAGTVNVQDTIVDTDDDFEVTTSDFQNLDPNTGGFLVVENENTGGRVEVDEVGETTTVVDVADVGGISDGDAITATLYDEENGTELDTDTTSVTREDETPAFNTLSAESDGSGGNNNIRSVNFDGTISNVDESGTIQFELEKDGDTYYSDSITMTEDFEFGTGNFDQANRRETPVEVRITLLDSDGTQYEQASGTFTDNNQVLSLNDGLTRD